MSDHPVPELIAPGQESVWDYPRPPALRASEELITVILGGEEICETRTSWQILETSHPPTYYLPRSAFVAGALRAAGGHSYCEWKGDASYLDVLGGGKVAASGRLVLPAAVRPLQRAAATTSRSIPARWTAAWSTASVVVPQEGGFYGGWITSAVSGPFKGGPGTLGW